MGRIIGKKRSKTKSNRKGGLNLPVYSKECSGGIIPRMQSLHLAFEHNQSLIKFVEDELNGEGIRALEWQELIDFIDLTGCSLEQWAATIEFCGEPVFVSNLMKRLGSAHSNGYWFSLGEAIESLLALCAIDEIGSYLEIRNAERAYRKSTNKIYHVFKESQLKLDARQVFNELNTAASLNKQENLEQVKFVLLSMSSEELEKHRFKNGSGKMNMRSLRDHLVETQALAGLDMSPDDIYEKIREISSLIDGKWDNLFSIVDVF
ncbi:hypothetical protein JCM19238_347 [Vibrio ponticus]|nr:hypothetical protein JCM19238_347 [Vibrio ponticus]